MYRKNPTQFKINLSKKYKEDEKEAIAEDILDYIRERSAKGKGPGNSKWPGNYSNLYVKSLDFKIAGKSKGIINQSLSGDMLTELEVVDIQHDSITIGYNEGNPAKYKAEGNIIGSYGKSSGRKKYARDFIKLTSNEIKKILKNYPIGTEQTRKMTKTSKESKKFVETSGEFESETEF